MQRTSSPPMQASLGLVLPSLLLLLVLLLLQPQGVDAERGFSKDAVDAFDLVDSIQTLLSTLLSGELFSRAGIEKHLHLLASLLSFGLSLGIIAGSCLLKLPQLLNIVKSQSVAGLSFLSTYAEITSGLAFVLFNIHSHTPLKNYGESIAILLQNLLLLLLLWHYSSPPPSLHHCLLPSLLILSLGAIGWSLPEHKDWAMRLTMPLSFAMRAPQIYTNYTNGHTGQLAALTVLMALAGSLARIFTTLKDLGSEDAQIKVYLLSVFLNAVIMAQIVWYREATKKAVGKGGSKGAREGGKEGGQSPVPRSGRAAKKTKEL